ncbi:MAG: hypothetical protein A2X86_16615 [Bdellovibrionales bacterium GWA2_49_15]|nr:MAG: hypothetical protein A2X86_16615 [Bdellovibrionales bacterium GWA2_49_15]HAZ13729.1 hypothetical protein [Bdellovibrionales bacterium]
MNLHIECHKVFLYLTLVLLFSACNSGGGGGGGNSSDTQSASVSSSAIQTNNVQVQVQSNIVEVNQAITADTSQAAQPVPPEELSAVSGELTLTEDELAALSSMQVRE